MSNEEKEKKINNKQNLDLKIMEWHFNQYLGERLTYRELKRNPNNQSYLVTDIKFSNESANVIVGDRGGRVIIFNNNKYKGKQKLDYFYEFQAQEKDFDIHKSIEYLEDIKALDVFPNDNSHKIDILSAGFRTIKLDRVYIDKIKVFDNVKKGSLNIPKLNTIKNEIKVKNKKVLKISKCCEINSLNINKFVTTNFLSSDDFRVYLFDVNSKNSDIYNPINIEVEGDTQNNVEKITKSKYTSYNPHIFFYGTNKGIIKLCDLRTNSNNLKFETNFSDENTNMKNLIGEKLSSVHDIASSYNNQDIFISRHYFNINLWDIRKQNEPLNKFLIYEPAISKLSYLYHNNYIEDKFSVDFDSSGKYILTGGYSNMFHIFDIEQKLNTQIVVDEGNDKVMNTNIVRKINSKGSCFYKKDDPTLYNINFNKKIIHHAYSPTSNFLLIVVNNCIYTYCGNLRKKK